MSAGPVGIGDRIGRTNREIVMRTCDDDGRIRHADRAARRSSTAACSASRRAATAGVGHDDGHDPRRRRTWTYVVALNASMPDIAVTDVLALHEIGIAGDRSVLDWRRGALTETDTLRSSLEPR